MGWIHRIVVSQPFTDTTWRHIRGVVERHGSRAEHEEELAGALDALLCPSRSALSAVGPSDRPTHCCPPGWPVLE
ncbi:hypothetical protein OG735_39560 [Streptomyces sp. NBC_01210]|uniref:hypothetical protein n=1 Tax=Streptomyces sp. NBC_01210 TaxID=2903774 RepID=UPI002E0FAD2F|nr:hypothetical protein OG735_39560 [Streptomyces sp. NBC_01210]